MFSRKHQAYFVTGFKIQTNKEMLSFGKTILQTNSGYLTSEASAVYERYISILVALFTQEGKYIFDIYISNGIFHFSLFQNQRPKWKEVLGNPDHDKNSK